MRGARAMHVPQLVERPFAWRPAGARGAGPRRPRGARPRPALGARRTARPSVGTIPTVLTVILRSGTAKPAGSRSTAMARSTSSRLSSGSPIPMKTTFVGRAPRCRAATAYCATISAAVRLRWSPRRPVSQKTHPRAHPACDETQTVHRSRDRNGVEGWWMSTASTAAPSSRRTANRTLPSGSLTASAAGNALSKPRCAAGLAAPGPRTRRPAHAPARAPRRSATPAASRRPGPPRG